MFEEMISHGVWMNFSGIYSMQDFYQETDLCLIEAEDLSGTNCYCDDDAVAELQKRMINFSYHGIHFLDSGNYHYMSKLWMEKIEEPFDLLVFDNHTDLQLPAFGGILSCGGWIASALEDIPMLKRVILIGPDEASYDLVDECFKKRIHFWSREMQKNCTMNEFGSWMNSITADKPLYISVDKDVLSEAEIKTNWSQGDFTMKQLQNLLHLFCEKWEQDGKYLLGMDVCGEADLSHAQKIEESNCINQKLLKFWLKLK